MLVELYKDYKRAMREGNTDLSAFIRTWYENRNVIPSRSLMEKATRYMADKDNTTDTL